MNGFIVFGLIDFRPFINHLFGFNVFFRDHCPGLITKRVCQGRHTSDDHFKMRQK